MEPYIPQSFPGQSPHFRSPLAPKAPRLRTGFSARQTPVKSFRNTLPTRGSTARTRLCEGSRVGVHTSGLAAPRAYVRDDDGSTCLGGGSPRASSSTDAALATRLGGAPARPSCLTANEKGACRPAPSHWLQTGPAPCGARVRRNGGSFRPGGRAQCRRRSCEAVARAVGGVSAGRRGAGALSCEHGEAGRAAAEGRTTRAGEVGRRPPPRLP